MKRFALFLLIGFAFYSEINAQDSHQYFALIYTTGENWDNSKNFTEQAYSKEHSEFLSNLKKDGFIALGARYSDKGFIVLKVKNEAEAKEILSKDLSVTHKTFNAELHYFSPFYYGCIEKE